MNKGGLYYINEMKKGRAVVIIPAESQKDYDTAIFYIRRGALCSFGANTGILNRTDITLNELMKHFDNMIEEGSSLFARGIVD